MNLTICSSGFPWDQRWINVKREHRMVFTYFLFIYAGKYNKKSGFRNPARNCIKTIPVIVFFQAHQFTWSKVHVLYSFLVFQLDSWQLIIKSGKKQHQHHSTKHRSGFKDVNWHFPRFLVSVFKSCCVWM